MYSLSSTCVLGIVACIVTSKCLDIGAGERSWSDMKMIKDGVRSNLSGDYLEKRVILYKSAHLEEERIPVSMNAAMNLARSLQIRIRSKLPFLLIL